jgi:hypothetical protein
VIWVKRLTNWCYMKREPWALPPMCGHDDDPDAWKLECPHESMHNSLLQE